VVRRARPRRSDAAEAAARETCKSRGDKGKAPHAVETARPVEWFHPAGTDIILIARLS
jgi:hypothetical protein